MSAQQSYGFKTTVNLSYEEAIGQVTAALKEQGFGVLTQIDVKATLKQKLDVDSPKYVILGACNPALAHRALQTEPEIGLLLPCNVIVYEDESTGQMVISIADPVAMMQIAGNPLLTEVANEARSRLEKVIAAVGKGSG